ncbi:MAG: type II toxin-antitoxin system RatA family toxin [Steroidobacteraceae bacterium]
MSTTIEKFGRLLPHSGEQLFDLVADVERYPEFLPGWISARILRREGNVCDVEQVLGFGPVRLPFVSRAVLHRPSRIDIGSDDAHFRHYSQSMLVWAQPAGGARLSIVARLELSSALLQPFASRMLPDSIEQSIAAFEARADHLYAPGGGTPPPRATL